MLELSMLFLRMTLGSLADTTSTMSGILFTLGALLYSSFVAMSMLLFLILILSFGLWLWAVVDCYKRDDFEGNGRLFWLFVIVLTGFFMPLLGAALYYFLVKKRKEEEKKEREIERVK